MEQMTHLICMTPPASPDLSDSTDRRDPLSCSERCLPGCRQVTLSMEMKVMEVLLDISGNYRRCPTSL